MGNDNSASNDNFMPMCSARIADVDRAVNRQIFLQKLNKLRIKDRQRVDRTFRDYEYDLRKCGLME